MSTLMFVLKTVDAIFYQKGIMYWNEEESKLSFFP